MLPETPLTPTERHNAVISYCFMAPFMLLSRDERFWGSFVRSHARYATLLEVLFLILIITLVRSRNFSSIIIFGASWVHISLFICFFVLLVFLIMGIYNALRGHKPKIGIQEFSWSSLKNIGTIHTDEDEKTPLVLSHIPFLGTYLSYKYWDFLLAGEKFGNWVFIIAAILLWIDPSFTLFIAWLSLATFWIVYQGILNLSGDAITLIWDKLPSKARCHILLRSVLVYIKLLVGHSKTLPQWASIVDDQTQEYEKFALEENIKSTLPIINIPTIIHSFKTFPLTQNICDATVMNIVTIMILWSGNISLIMVLALAIWSSYWSIKRHKNSSMPVIAELGYLLFKAIEWVKKKNVTRELHIPSR